MHGSQETLVDDFLASSQATTNWCKVENYVHIVMYNLDSSTRYRLWWKLLNLVWIKWICKDSEIYVGMSKNLKAFFLSFSSFSKTNEKILMRSIHKKGLYFLIGHFLEARAEIAFKIDLTYFWTRYFFLVHVVTGLCKILKRMKEILLLFRLYNFVSQFCCKMSEKVRCFLSFPLRLNNT